MFIPNPELSDDLEWMLQSGQASPGMLIEALVNRYATDVFRLARAVVNSHDLAEQATEVIFIDALLGIYRYRGSMTVDAWFYRVALESLQKFTRKQPSVRQARHSNSPQPVSIAEADLWRSVDSLSDPVLLPLLLVTVLGWEKEAISQVLKLSLPKLELRVDSAFKSLQKALPAALDFDEWVSASLQRRWPRIELEAGEMEAIANRVEARAKQNGAIRKRFAYLRELVMIGAAIVLAVGLFRTVEMLIPVPAPASSPARGAPDRSGNSEQWRGPSMPRSDYYDGEPTATPFPEDVFYIVSAGDELEGIAKQAGSSIEELLWLNRLVENEPLLPGQRLLIPGRLPAYNQVEPTAVVSQTGATAMNLPLTSEDIYGILAHPSGNWSTIWVDAQVLSYGPVGFIGPAKVSRLQVWNSPTQFLVLGGPPSGLPEQAILRSGFQLYRAEPGGNQPWFVEMERSARCDNPLFEQLGKIFPYRRFSSRLSDTATFVVAGQEISAGRDAFVVDQLNSAGDRETRYWLDAETGFILRRQEYGGTDYSIVMSEVIVTAISFDQVLPQDLLTPSLPWRGGYAGDFSGKPEQSEPGAGIPVTGAPPGREQMGHQLPPHDFEPQNSTLAFQLKQSELSSPSEGDDEKIEVDVFGNGYLLGSLDLPDPWQVVCSRSPDGSRVAYGQRSGRFGMRWASLLDLDATRSLAEIHAHQFVFAPDSRRIALFKQNGFQGEVQILDTDTGEILKLIELASAKSLAWSPDGASLALIGIPKTTPIDEKVMVIDTQTGEVTYSQSIDWQSNRTGEWPMVEWGVDFPVEMGGLEACVSSPGE